MEIKRGDIFYADLSPVVGSEQGGVRPVLIIQNNRGNRHSSTVLVAAITSQRHILLLCASFWLLRWIFYITRTFNRKFTNTCVNCLITLYVFYM